MSLPIPSLFMYGRHKQHSVAVWHQSANEVVADERDTVRNAGHHRSLMRQSPTPRGQLESKACVAPQATHITLCHVGAVNVKARTREEERVVGSDETAALLLSQRAGPGFEPKDARCGFEATNKTPHGALSPCSIGNAIGHTQSCVGDAEKMKGMLLFGAWSGQSIAVVVGHIRPWHCVTYSKRGETELTRSWNRSRVSSLRRNGQSASLRQRGRGGGSSLRCPLRRDPVSPVGWLRVTGQPFESRLDARGCETAEILQRSHSLLAYCSRLCW